MSWDQRATESDWVRIVWTPEGINAYYFERVTPPVSSVGDIHQTSLIDDVDEVSAS